MINKWGLLLVILATLCWGTCYSCLRKSNSDISPLIVQFIYGLWTCIISGGGMIIWYRQNLGNLWTILDTQSVLWIAGYSVLSAAGGLLFLAARSIEGVSITVLTVISGCYTVITVLEGVGFFGDYSTLNMWYVGFGTFLAVCGVSLISLAPK